jgi:DNA-binding transcriptional regulator YdaS (Cro superfamily)
MSLSQQEKLALMMTSAGSQRNLASLLGVTHQTLGRWLKSDYIDPAGRLIVERDASGRRAGVKEIPREASAAINAAFSFHKQVTREQAKIDRVPYDPNFPIFYERPKSRIDGKPSLRFIAKQTQFIHPQLRRDVITSVALTNRVAAFTIRSDINLYTYTKAKSATPTSLDNAFTMQGDTDQKNRPTLRASYLKRVDDKIKNPQFAPVSTLMGDLRTKRIINKSINEVESKLRERHSPNALPNGFANQFVFQLKENQNANKPPAKRKPAKRKK